VSSILSTLESVPTSDWYISILAISIISISLLTAEVGVHYFHLPLIYTRKFIHIITGLIVCIIAYFLSSNLPIIIFATLYIFIDLWALRNGKFKSIHPDSRSFGTIFYALSVITLVILFWDGNKPLFLITNLIMIIPDAMAALIGERYANSYFVPVSEKKSLIGAITMFILTNIIVISSLQYFYDNPPGINLIIGLLIGTIASISELLSIRGSDNLSVPLLSGLFLYALLVLPGLDILWSIVIGTFCAAMVAIISYKFRFLNIGGSMIAFLMGSIIFGFGGWAYTFAILGFFILSSILSRIGKKKKKQIESMYQKSGVRDFHQALANGGVATAIVLVAFFSGFDYLYYVYIAALAAATADTWGTELGIFSMTKPVLITTFKPVNPGTSGGISMVGSIASLLGSFVIVVIGSFFYEFNTFQFGVVVISGFAGSLFDSVLGATVQGQFRCQICSKITESKSHCDTKAIIYQGIKSIDNDIVNIFSIIFAALITFLIIIKDI
jgi:uncharacterized protein (TIGR00297 family)